MGCLFTRGQRFEALDARLSKCARIPLFRKKFSLNGGVEGWSWAVRTSFVRLGAICFTPSLPPGHFTWGPDRSFTSRRVSFLDPAISGLSLPSYPIPFQR